MENTRPTQSAKVRQILALGLALCLLPSVLAVRAQISEAPVDETWTIPGNEAVRQLLAERLGSNGVGAVVGIVEPAGRRVVVYGKSGASDGRALDGETVFQIGSVTKVFTGLLLADMVVRGEAVLEDPAAKYLPPGVRMPRHGRAITLIDLSKHWSGLPSMPTNFSLTAQPNPYEAYTEQQLYEFLNGYQPRKEPGSQEYSNLGVALLGRLLARRAGMEYEPFLRQRVLIPLGLEGTSITLATDQRKRLAPGHDRFGEPVETWELRAMPASGSLRSTANDLLRFLEFNLGVRETPLAPAMQLQRTPGRTLGWGRSMLSGKAVYGHEGGKEGYRSAVLFDPQTKTGVVILINSRSEESPMGIARYLLGGQQLPPVRPAQVRPKRVSVRRKTLEAYSGQYRFESGEVLNVMRSNDRLLANIPGDGVFTLLPTGGTTFFSNTEDVAVVFERNQRDIVTGLVMQQSGGARPARRLH